MMNCFWWLSLIFLVIMLVSVFILTMTNNKRFSRIVRGVGFGAFTGVIGSFMFAIIFTFVGSSEQSQQKTGVEKQISEAGVVEAEHHPCRRQWDNLRITAHENSLELFNMGEKELHVRVWSDDYELSGNIQP